MSPTFCSSQVQNPCKPASMTLLDLKSGLNGREKAMLALAQPGPGKVGDPMYPKTWLSEHSLYFESYFTHLLLQELMHELLMTEHPRRLTVLKAEVDSEGYDLVLACGPTLRYVQFKTLGRRASPVNYSIKASLADLPGGCVLWLCYDQESLTRTHYHLLAGAPGEPLGTLLPSSQAQKRKNGEWVKRDGYVHVKTKDANHKNINVTQLAHALFGIP